jgi:hypothetical protein
MSASIWQFPRAGVVVNTTGLPDWDDFWNVDSTIKRYLKT